MCVDFIFVEVSIFRIINPNLEFSCRIGGSWIYTTRYYSSSWRGIVCYLTLGLLVALGMCIQIFFICIKVFRFSFLGSVCMPLIYLWNFQFHFDGGVSVFLSEVWF